MNTNFSQTLPKIRRGGTTSQLILSDQYYPGTKTRHRHHKEKELQINIFYKYGYKNPQQNTSKLILTKYKKNYIP